MCEGRLIIADFEITYQNSPRTVYRRNIGRFLVPTAEGAGGDQEY
jgi:hypothetical protein